MLKVHVWYHKDGDHLVIVKVPWWLDIYEWLVNRICPCCGLLGWLSSKSEKLEVLLYRPWNYLLGYTLKVSKDVYKVPVEYGCVVARALWNDNSTCGRDDCPNCWDAQDDAYVWKESDMMHR